MNYMSFNDAVKVYCETIITQSSSESIRKPLEKQENQSWLSANRSAATCDVFKVLWTRISEECFWSHKHFSCEG